MHVACKSTIAQQNSIQNLLEPTEYIKDKLINTNILILY